MYAFGTLRMTYPSKSVEAEMLLALQSMRVQTGSSVNAYFNPHVGYGLELLSQGQYDYLLRDACFILTTGKIDAYLVQPRSYAEFYSMVAAANLQAGPTIHSAIIGQRGPIASPNACNGLQLEIVYCDQVFSVIQAELEQYLTETLPVGSTPLISAGSLPTAISQLVFQMTDNMGTSPEHRALNYVALRYPLIYDRFANMNNAGYRLLRVEVLPSDTDWTRDVVFVYQHHEIGQVTQWRCTVDVSGQYPFISRRLSQAYPTRPIY